MEQDRNMANQEKPVKWYRYDAVDSTNNEARRLVVNGLLGVPAVVLAARQTAGRGRQGKTFYSPKNTGIYMSIVMDFPEEEKDAALLTVRTSVAVSDAIYELTKIETGIKWVNDLYLGDRKICGILTESVLYGQRRYAIIGIGINVSTESFPDELREKAGSLGAFAGRYIESLPAAILEHVLPISAGRGRQRDLEEYRKRSVVLGNVVTYERDGGQRKGRAAAIDASGALLIDLGGGNYDRLQSGEISLKTWK
ncbi:MAG: biotin--[acetyl-CoA-carboxylase] ligase [Clostridia bacterium]